MLVFPPPAVQSRMRQMTNSFAVDAAAQTAMRELRRHLRQPTTAVALCCVALVLAIFDAFGLGDAAGLGVRLVYLMVMVWSTYAIGCLVAGTFGAWLERRRMPSVLAWILQGAVAGIFILAAVLGLNWLMFGWAGGGAIGPLAATVISSAIVITVGIEFVSTRRQATGAAERTPPLLDRLPHDRRGNLLALSAEDHYTRVRTSGGETLLLMRLSDAIKEAEPTVGLQVHRSHWIAQAAVTAARRGKDKATLTLCDGAEIPVSRTYLPLLREAGLLECGR